MREQWCVSPINYRDEIVSAREKVTGVSLTDCTLRESEQQVDANFRPQDKVRIALAMEEMGIREIEIGYPAVSEENAQAARDVVNSLKSPDTKTRVVCRGLENDFDLASDIGIWGVSVSLGGSDLTRIHRLKWSRERVLETALRMCEYAKKKGLYVILSSFDTTRTDLDFLDNILSEVVRAGTVDCVRLVDSMGTAIPAATGWLVKFMRQRLGSIPVEIHCHNDFGLATANTLAALDAGSTRLTSTVNGFGERVGNAPTDEVLMALKVFYGIDLGVDLTKLSELSRLVCDITGVPIASNKPIVGANAFRHESGMVVTGLRTEPFSGEPFAPEMVGQTRQILIGKGSGKTSIQWNLEMLGLEPSDEEIMRTLAAAKKKATDVNRFLTKEEFAAIAKANVKA